MNIYEVRNRTAALLEALLEVWEASVRATHHFLSDAEVMQIKQYVPHALEAVSHLVIVEREQGRPIAFLGVECDQLEMLFLLPAERGKGLGAHMLQYAIENYGVRELTVNEQNPQAVGFYAHMGFRTYKRTEVDEQGNPYPLLYMHRRMGKQDVYRYLTAQRISYEVLEHKAIFNMEELSALALPHPEWDAKNLFLWDDRQQYFLLTVQGDKRVDLKQFRKAHGLRPLRFAPAEELESVLGLIPGAVTPLGILNDDAHQVRFYLDSAFAGNKIAVHPNDNTATVWMQADDLMKLIQHRGSPAEYAEL